MKCPNCGNENPENANFCFNCAHSLKEKKDSTEPLRFNKYIPSALMKKLQSSDKLGGIENERRIVTILFCDVVGSTSFAENLDPEDWTEIINGAFDYIIPPVYKYEGMIARLMGDAILAFFGAPISHEDDPERAILAALDILKAIKEYSKIVNEKWGFDLDVRVGINTGLVVVGEIGSDLRVEYTAMGDAINVAARMESTAATGTIQITQNTFKLVSYYFEAQKLGEVEIKGKAQPITTFEIIRKKPISPENSQMEQLATSFVEREDELHLLNNLSSMVMKGESQICWINGEAGIGKSRLLSELHSLLFLEDKIFRRSQNPDPNNEKFYWFETGALPYQISTPFGPIINFFQRYFGITIDMANDEKYELIRKGLENLDRSAEIFPYVALLLQVNLKDNDLMKTAFLDPSVLQEETFLAIISFLEDFAQIAPLILVFDDIQWADQSSQALLAQILDLILSKRIFLIILSREAPEDENIVFSKISKSFSAKFHAIPLQHLTQFGSESLISSILKVENLSDELRQLIVSRAQGNPFYVEELVKSFIDSKDIVKEAGTWKLTTDMAKLNVPATLNNLLMTRLDQLDEKTRRVAQSASVIGREFMMPILQCLNTQPGLLDDSIKELEERDWIVEKYLGIDRGYFFKHVLSRDVAYNSLLFKRRKELHRQIAECLKSVDISLSDEIGRHLYQSDEFEEALPFIVKSAESAIRTNSIPEAITLLSQGEKIQDQVSDFDAIVKLYLALGDAHAMGGNIDNSGEYFSKLLDLSKEKENKKGEVLALNKLAGNAMYGLGDTEKADSYLQEAEKLGNLINFPEGLLETSAIRCVMHQTLGEFDKSTEYEELGIEFSEKLQNDVFAVSFRYNLIVSHVLSLRFDEAQELINDFLATYEREGEKYFTASVYGYLYSAILFRQGKFLEAIQKAEHGIQIAEKINARFPLYLAFRALGEFYQFLGDLEKSAESYEKSILFTSKASNYGFLATSKLSLANVKFQMGEDVQDLITEGLDLLKRPNGTFWGGRVWGDLGYYYLAKNEFDADPDSPPRNKEDDKKIDYPSRLIQLIETKHFSQLLDRFDFTPEQIQTITSLSQDLKSDPVGGNTEFMEWIITKEEKFRGLDIDLLDINYLFLQILNQSLRRTQLLDILRKGFEIT